jgi:hypothetical protein
MSERNTVLRSMHDIGLAGWFGGSLMGAVGLNGAAAQAVNPAERLQIASAGWDRWAPVNLAAIGTHLAGGGGNPDIRGSPRGRPKGSGSDERDQDGAHGRRPLRNRLQPGSVQGGAGARVRQFLTPSA